MSDSHDHPQEQHSQNAVPVVVPPRTASQGTMITMLRQRIEEKMAYIARLEDTEVNLAAVANDLQNENAALIGMLDQVRAENSILRKRLGLDEVGAIEPLEGEGEQAEESVEEPAVAETTETESASE